MGVYYFGYLVSRGRVFLAISRKKEMRLLEQEKSAHVFDCIGDGLSFGVFPLYSGIFLIWFLLRLYFIEN